MLDDIILYALNGKLRRRIVEILSNGPKTTHEIRQELGDSKPVYRQSINKALVILRKANLVEKLYSEKSNKFYYNLRVNEIRIKFNQGQLTIEETIIKK